MRTTLDLDPKLLEQMPELTGEKTPSKALNKLMAEALRKKKLAQLRAFINSPEYIDSLVDNWRENEELELEDMRRNLH
jgi:hypothetical protein